MQNKQKYTHYPTPAFLRGQIIKIDLHHLFSLSWLVSARCFFYTDGQIVRLGHLSFCSVQDYGWIDGSPRHSRNLTSHEILFWPSFHPYISLSTCPFLLSSSLCRVAFCCVVLWAPNSSIFSYFGVLFFGFFRASALRMQGYAWTSHLSEYVFYVCIALSPTLSVHPFHPSPIIS